MDALMKSIPDYIYFKDEECRFIRISESMVKLFPGANKASELVGKSDFDFHKKENAERFYKDEKEIMNTRKALIDDIVKEEFDDGRAQWVSTTKMPLKDKNGNVMGIFGISKNITQLKETEEEAVKRSNELEAHEEELRQNLEELQATQDELQRINKEQKKTAEQLKEEKYLMDAMMDNLPDNIYFKDRESKFLRVSNNLLQSFGVKKQEELIGKSDFDFFTKEHAQQAFDDEQNIIRTGKAIVNMIEKETWEDGAVSWVSTTKMPLKDQEGNVVGTFGISKDVSDLKEMEIKANKMAKDLMWESAMFKTLMDHLDSRVTFKDQEGTYVRVNKAKAIKHGFKDPSKIIGKSDYDFFPEEHAKEAIKLEKDLIAKNKPILNKDEKLVYKDGRIRWGLTNRIPFANEQGEIIGTFTITRDTTDVKEAHAEILNKDTVIDGVSANVPVLVYQIDPKDSLQQIQGKGLDLMGKKEGDVKGKKVTTVFPESKEKLKSVFKSKRQVTFETKGHYNGQECSIKHYLFADNKIEGGIVGYAFKTKLI